MSRRCALTNKGVHFGNNVSHANNKSRRRFMPNLRQVSLPSDILGIAVKLRLSANGIRSVEHAGGIDSFLMAARNDELASDALKLKKLIAKKTSEQSEQKQA